MNILMVSGFSSDNYLSFIRRDDDSRSDFLIALCDYFSSIGNVHASLNSCSRKDIDLEVHINCQIPRTSAKKILFYFEDVNVRPQNHLASCLHYTKVFSIFNLSLRRNQTHYLSYPHELEIDKNAPSFFERSIGASMLGTNRNVIFNGSKSLYNQRQEVIKLFESTNNCDFRLFGRDWDKAFVKCGVSSRIKFEVSKRLVFNSTGYTSHKKLKNWHGIASSKHEILKNSKFNFCFENIYGLDGYISEKLLDSLICGAVPIYYPSYDIDEEFLPPDLYYDYRDFENSESLIDFINNFDDEAYRKWRALVQDFLPTLKKRHSIETFLSQISGAVKNILEERN